MIEDNALLGSEKDQETLGLLGFGKEQTLQEKAVSLNNLLNSLVKNYNFSNEKYEQISSILKFINGTVSAYSPESVKDKVILLIGPTGAGKSTLLNYIVGKELIVKEIPTGLGLYTTNPVSPIGNGQGSTTFIPNIWSVGDSSFIDCAGDFDTNGTVKECLNSLIKQKIAQIAKQIKIVIVCTQASLTAEGSYGALFKEGLSKSAQFLGNINDFKENISLVVSHAKRNKKVKEDIKNSLNAILNQDGNPMGEYAETLKYVADNNRFMFFCSPSDEASDGDVYSVPEYLGDQRKEIQDLINLTIQFKTDIKPDQYFKVTYSNEVALTMNVVIEFIKSRSINELVQYLTGLTSMKIKVDVSKLRTLLTNLTYLSTDGLAKSMSLSEYWSEIHKDNLLPLPNSDDTEQFQRLMSEMEFMKNFTTKSTSFAWGQLSEIDKHLKPVSEQMKKLIDEPTAVFSNVSGVLIISGFKVHVSEVVKLLPSQNFSDLRIFALESITFDGDLILKSKNLSILAPEWNVPGNAQINISGDETTEYPDGIRKQELASNVPGSRGKDGKPGLPGKSSGNFLGCGIVFNGLSNLSIHCNGGKGGAGQGSSDGTKGSDQLFTVASDPENIWATRTYIQGQPHWEEDVIAKFIVGNRAFVNSKWEDVSEGLKIVLTSEGKRGGDAGNPGVGGLGGYSGYISLYDVSKKSKVTSQLKLSESIVGVEGPVGESGVSGAHGKGMIYTGVFKTQSTALGAYLGSVVSHKTEDNIYPFPPHRSPNNNGQGRSTPGFVNSSPIDSQTSFANFILSKNATLKSIDIIGSNFVQKVDDCQEQFAFSQISELIAKAIVLEENFSLKHSDSYINYFRELKDVCTNYFKTNSTKLSKGDVALLNYIYSLICSGVVRFNSYQNTSLVVDIKAFFDQILVDIAALEKTETASMKEIYKNEYKSTLESYIKEANSSIKDLLADVNSYKKTIDDSLAGMVDEVEKMIKDAEKNDEKLREQKQKLEKSIIIQGILGGLKVFGQALGFLGPIGMGVGGLINSGAEIAQGFVPADPDTPGKMVMPESVKTGLSQVQNFYKTQQSLDDRELKRQLDILDYEVQINKLKKDPSYLIQKVDDANTNWEQRINIYKGFFEHEPQYAQLMDMEIKLEKAKPAPDAAKIKDLESQRDISKLAMQQKEKQDITDRMNGKQGIITGLEKAAIAATMAKTIIDTYNGINVTQSKITVIEEQITKNAENIKLLDQKEDDIAVFNDEIVSSVEKNIDSFAENLESKTHVRLDVDKWNLKQSINSIKAQFTEFTKGFKAEGELVACFQRLNDGFDVIIGIYDRIQSYQDQIEFSNFITGINNVEVFNSVPEQYKDQMRKFIQTIQRNVLIEQYQKAMKAFEQWSFPFYGYYVAEIENDIPGLKPFLSSEGSNVVPSKEDITPQIVRVITTLSKKIKEQSYLVTPKMDNVVFNSKFDVTHPFEPFCSWSYNSYSYLLDNLFNGEECTFVASIKSSHHEAVKFSTIGLKFEHQDPEKNKKLQEILKLFQIQMVHSGLSNYQFDTQLYQISSNGPNAEKLKLIYQYFDIFSQDSSSMPSDLYNETFRKLTKSVAIISPYTTWSISIHAIDKVNPTNDFQTLRQFLDQEKTNVTMNLIGFGTFIDGARFLKISDYYKQYLAK